MPFFRKVDAKIKTFSKEDIKSKGKMCAKCGKILEETSKVCSCDSSPSKS